MAGFNKVILEGRLGKDPELNYTQNGTAVANLSLATSENYKDKDGQRQEKTEWHKIVVWDKNAENAAKFLGKGSEALVEGKLQTKKWQDKEGNDRYTTEVVAQRVVFVGGAKVAAADTSDRPQQTQQGSGAMDDDAPF